MAARSIGSLTLSFGLVAIPVKLYSAAQSESAVSFNLLHKDCGSRLKQQYVCLKHGSVVERDDMIKGYEFAKDQYVTFSPAEIKALEEAGTHSVDISEFVPIDSIDPVYFDKSYYLAPDKGAAKPYGLLNQALTEAKRCAVGHWVARGKDHVVLVRPMGPVLAMQQLYFAADVRPAAELDVPAVEVKPVELKLARQLIDQQSVDRYEPTAYTDEHRARVQAEIQKKVAGQEISTSIAAPAAEDGKVIDLMEALRASIARSEVERIPAGKLGPRKAPKRAESPAAKPARRAARR